MRPLLPPAILLEELPRDASTAASVLASRKAIAGALKGTSDRLVVFAGARRDLAELIMSS